jgi:transcriptional regulator with XRE-family HTH domain
LADEASYLGVSKSTLILYEKRQSLPSLAGLLLLAKQAEVAPASFLQEPLLSPKPVTPLKNPKRHRWLWPVIVASILVIASAIIVPLSIKQYQNDHGIVSYEDQTFEGLYYCWLRSEDGQDKTAVLNAGTTTAFSIKFHFFKPFFPLFELRVSFWCLSGAPSPFKVGMSGQEA